MAFTNINSEDLLVQKTNCQFQGGTRSASVANGPRVVEHFQACAQRGGGTSGGGLRGGGRGMCSGANGIGAATGGTQSSTTGAEFFAGDAIRMTLGDSDAGYRDWDGQSASESHVLVHRQLPRWESVIAKHIFAFQWQLKAVGNARHVQASAEPPERRHGFGRAEILFECPVV